jgi:ribosomal protein S18 acetylase RimI-like enzyme
VADLLTIPAPLPASRTDQFGAPFVVRRMETSDRPRLEAFYDDFHPKRAAQGLPPEGRGRVARWLDTVLKGGTHLLVEEGGELRGHAFLIPGEGEGEAEYAIFLHQVLRGRGVGTQVNRLAAEVARADGVRKLWLSVEPHNRPAIRSYQKAGYQFRPASLYATEVEMELELAPPSA